MVKALSSNKREDTLRNKNFHDKNPSRLLCRLDSFLYVCFIFPDRKGPESKEVMMQVLKVESKVLRRDNLGPWK